jgi:hypothetical protein
VRAVVGEIPNSCTVISLLWFTHGQNRKWYAMAWRVFCVATVAVWVLSAVAQIQKRGVQPVVTRGQQSVPFANAPEPTTGHPASVPVSVGEGDVNLRSREITAGEARPADHGPGGRWVKSEVTRARSEAEKRFREIDQDYAREMCMLHKLWIEDIDAEIMAASTRQRVVELEKRRQEYAHDARKYCEAI